MRLGVFEFNPSVGITVLTAAVVILLASLGNWQMNRAEQKRDLLAQYAERAQSRPVPIEFSRADPDAIRYQHVEAFGQYDPNHQFLLDNQIREGVPGYEVLTPLKVAGRARAVLVNRGWIPLGGSRERLPDVSFDVGAQQVTGTIYVPLGEAFSLGGMEEGAGGWPRRIQYLDFARMEERLGYPLAHFTVRLDPGEPYGFRRDWQPVAFTPERHVAYAVQWYGLAGVLFILFMVLNTQRIKRT